MPRLKQLIAVLILVLSTQPGRAFSLLGPLPGGANDAWQTAGLSYNAYGNDIGGPKNLGEEYRWNVPVITYGFDSSFINYFGSNGVAAVDEAFAILNSLPDLTTLSSNLDEYPLRDPFTGAATTFRDSRHVNPRAEADNLLDLRSVALGMVVEQLGLASSDRWTWALRARAVVGNPPVTNYSVIQRNFDPAAPHGYSKYVNGNRYTYDIQEFAVPAYADALEIPVDPESAIHGFDAVSGISGGLDLTGIGPGIYYSYLTRDDIGGLAYIYNRNNLHWESFPPNTLQYKPDFTAGPIFLTNLDLTLFSLRASVVSPITLSNIYPGLIITQATPTNTIVSSNTPVVVTEVTQQPFITNNSLQVLVSNIDLGTFSSVTLTSAPGNLVANLQAAFPGVPNLDQLVILSTNNVFTNVPQIASIVITNAPKQPWDDPFTTNFIVQTNYTTNGGFLYYYSFRNVLTNYPSPISVLRRITTGMTKEPWSDALNPIYRNKTNDFVINQPSGGIIIVPTNLVGYAFTGAGVTNVLPITNFFSTTNVIDINGLIRTVSETDITFFTNVQFAAFPIEISTNGFVTNTYVTNSTIPTNIVTYSYAFANVLTNYSGPNTPATTVVYEVTPDPANPFFNRTNVLSVTATNLPVPSGGFLIDTNQTGFLFLFTNPPVVLQETNTLIDFTDPNTGVRTIEEVRYNFTNEVYQVVPFVLTNPPASVLRPGIGKLNFQRIGGGVFTGTNYLFTNRYVVDFYDNGRLTNGSFVNVQTLPDLLFRAADLGTTANGVYPIQFARGSGFINQAGINSTDPGQPGPGIITGSIALDFSKVGPTMLNEFPGFVTEASSLSGFIQPFVWGKFDGSTNAPIVFPSTIFLQDIELRKTGGALP